MKYKEYKKLDLREISSSILKFWNEQDIFVKSVEERAGKTPFVFYEGPPSANGLPGIHHVMARAIKDIFCRYKTQKGYQVKRKAGWDTHGLPVELGVEKSLGITKEDIGTKITVEEYNLACRKDVMKYTDEWRKLTELMGYWVDMDNPYVTYDNKYIETVWWLLGEIYNKGLLYKGYTIQPYSPAAGTGLSTHELNQPGCYKNVKDTTVVAQFQLLDKEDTYFLAWTTTPWTLPSNTALAVGKNIIYVQIRTCNPYTGKEQSVILAKDLVTKYFNPENEGKPLSDFVVGAKTLPYTIEKEMSGKDLEGTCYAQLLPYAQPTDGDAFKVVLGDFVTTEDGTGIVHIAPSFGSDDFRVAKQNGIGSLTLVDKRGKFTEEVSDFAFEYVKEAYLSDAEKEAERIKQGRDKYLSVDERIAIKLKTENKAFKVEKYEHSYPHCWRTDKPVLYYPLDSWFVKTTEIKDKLISLNKTISWKPESTGTGRFGNWLENLQDWNLSRSRFWGIPLPIWRSESGETLLISSVAQLQAEIEKSIEKGFMKTNPLKDFKPGGNTADNYLSFDLHKPYVDEIVLVSTAGEPMKRELDLIDVWFDSGSMPYAQLHYPFENKELIDNGGAFPADFIAEGVDQTRGWFFTLHAISALVFDSVAYKTVVSNGLVLDKDGNKMSKRLGNAVNPFEALDKHGADAIRWYMITNAAPWDNLKYNEEFIEEAKRSYFGTLYNTYSFFALYANIDGFSFKEDWIPLSQRPELDRWILSSLHSLIKEVDEAYQNYEPTKAGRAMERFLDENLSNWYVRLSRRRFWKGEYEADKISAYQTLYTCIEVLAKLMAPIAPFFADRLYQDLNAVTQKEKALSVHLTDFPLYDIAYIDTILEERMQLAQDISSMVLSLRKKSNIRVRQPLQRIMIPILDSQYQNNIEAVKGLILSEVNVKEIEYLPEDSNFLVKKAKPDFKKLGPRYGKQMKAIQEKVLSWGGKEISELEANGRFEYDIDGVKVELLLDDIEILTQDIEGWLVASSGKNTVALDITLTEELKQEGLAREFINRVQNIRKNKGFEVTDRISIQVEPNILLSETIQKFYTYICTEILADSIQQSSEMGSEFELIDLEEFSAKIHINKN